MRVRVLYFGALKDAFRCDGEWLELAAGASVADLVRVCRGRFANGIWESIAVAVNREYAQPSDVLKEGDEVALLPPVSGGSVGFDVPGTSNGTAGKMPWSFTALRMTGMEKLSMTGTPVGIDHES